MHFRRCSKQHLQAQGFNISIFFPLCVCNVFFIIIFIILIYIIHHVLNLPCNVVLSGVIIWELAG